jgi:membrane associated rhomboid family serine protease
MRRIEWQNLISFDYLDDKNRLRNKSVMDIGADQKRVKNNEIILIVLITIFVLFFFATSLKVFIALLVFGLVIGIFGLIKLYKERRERTMKRRRIFRIIERGIKFLKELLLGGAKFKW